MENVTCDFAPKIKIPFKRFSFSLRTLAIYNQSLGIFLLFEIISPSNLLEFRLVVLAGGQRDI